ncbi:hypothetical protein ACQPW1_38315 [Nocardia sp. CA-128927]|uniref:hypothetical protein n=1 Tax=Nocardia sp. CA-128927 TaxID=3239975 RepID=UPI003D992004
MVPEAGEEGPRGTELTTGTLDHCVEHLTTSAEIFVHAKYSMIWFDDYTFCAELPDGWFLFRLVQVLKARTPGYRPLRGRLTAAAQRFRPAQRPDDTSDESRTLS